MEEVVDATGAGSRRDKTPSATFERDNKNEQPPSSAFSRSAGLGSVSVPANKVNRDSTHSVPRAFPSQAPAVGSPSPDLDSHSDTAVDNALHFEGTLSGQQPNLNHSSSCSKSDRMSGELGLENGTSVKVVSQLDGINACLPDSCSWHLSRRSSGAGSPLGQLHRTPRRTGRRRTQGRGGNMVMFRGRRLVCAVRGELEKAATSAKTDQSSMQVM